MKKNGFKYLVVGFFVLLFLFKGVASIGAELLNVTISEKLFDASAEEEKKNAEEKTEAAKALYLCNEFQNGIDALDFSLVSKNIQYRQLKYKQSVYLSISTPPPEIV